MSLFAAASQGTAPVLDVLTEGRNAANKTVQNNIAADQEYYSMRNANISGLMKGASPLVSQLGGQFGTSISGIFGGSAPAQTMSWAGSPQMTQATFGSPTYHGAMSQLQPYIQGAQALQQQQMAVNMAPPANMGGPLNFGSFIRQ